MTLSKTLVFGSLLLVGCITSKAAKEPSMTALEHEDAARRAEQRAVQEERRRDPDIYSVQRCGNMGSPALQGPASAPQAGFNASGMATPPTGDPCGSWFDEKRDHEIEAERQRLIAAQHRSAAAKLRGGQAQACNNLPDEERMARPLDAPRDNLLAVRELPDYSRTGKASGQRGGATVLLRDQPGLSAEQLERVLQCDAARAMVEGGAEHTPWAVPGAKASVVQTNLGMLVEVTANDRKTAEEIARRAALLSESVR
jgi:hypothetical protein